MSAHAARAGAVLSGIGPHDLVGKHLSVNNIRQHLEVLAAQVWRMSVGFQPSILAHLFTGIASCQHRKGEMSGGGVAHSKCGSIKLLFNIGLLPHMLSSTDSKGRKQFIYYFRDS